MRRLLPPLPLIAPSIISGILVTLTFPTANIWPLAFVALVPVLAAWILHAPSPRDAFRAGFLFGFSMYLTELWWIVRLIPSADVTIPGLMSPALLLLALYMAVFPAAVFWLITWVGLRGRASYPGVVVAFPAVWVLLEAVKSRGLMAFPWGSIGYALCDVPALIQSAEWFGIVGLSFVVALVNVLIAGVFTVRKTPARIAVAICAVGVVAAMWTHGRAAIANWSPGDAPRVKVAIVQPNVDLVVKWKPEFRDSTLALIERLSVEAAQAGAELIVFPETSAPVYIEGNSQYKSRLVALSRRLGVPIYIGFLDYRYDGPGATLNIFNSSGLFTPSGGLSKYDKNHLLPFGEALPLSDRFRWLRKIEFGQANFQSGTARGPIDAGIRFTPLICFESVFPYLCARGVAGGSQMFVNITNDGWFGDTPGPYQHAQMSILRAVEFRRYVVRSANSGVSWVVEPTGDISQELGLYVGGTILADVAALDGRTLYSRLGDFPPLAAALTLFGLGVLMGRRRHGNA